MALEAADLAAMPPFVPAVYGESRPSAVVLVGGAGDNVAHMAVPLNELAGQGHNLHVFDFHEPARPNFPVTQTHLTDTEAGQASAAALIESGEVGKVYLSVPPEAHRDEIIKYLGYAARGLIAGVVTTKPVVQNRRERMEVDQAHSVAMGARRLLAERTGNMALAETGDALLWIHEHYQRKEAERELYRRLGEVTAVLGHLTDVVIDIEEARNVERPRAFGTGALGDLGPHAISIALDVSHAINNATGGRYTLSGRPQSQVQQFRYEDAPAELDADVATGFIVHDRRTLTDHERGNSESEVSFTLMGGKGLVDRKLIALTFEHPETGELNVVTADLQTNTVQVPEAVSHLFPRTQFSDNGYGRVMLAGLNGGDPNISFQHWNQAKLVVGIQEDLTALARRSELRPHRRGLSLQELDTYGQAA